MKQYFLVAFIFLFAGFASAAMNPAPEFCTSQGYQIVGDDCVFDDASKCGQWEFFRGECGVEHKREHTCAALNSPVFTQFQSCCEGSPHLPSMMAGQPYCRTLPDILVSEFSYNSLYWAAIVAVIVAAVFLVIRNKKTAV